MKRRNFLDLRLQGINQHVWQDGSAVFIAFTATHDDLFIVEINVLDAQANALHQTQAATVEYIRHKPVETIQVSKYREHLIL